MKLLLVDGSNLLFQMFYGMPARIVNKSGKAIHGVMGFVGALRNIIGMTEPTHIAVLFDGEHENARAAVEPSYKANRPDYSAMPAEEVPFSQLPDIYAALDLWGIPHAETTDCETDDWIAGYALTYGADLKIVISSFDSDYFQLLSENVSVLRYRGKGTEIVTPSSLSERYGIPPSRYAAFKAIVGDGSDNLKGAYKIGPKRAAKLLGEYQTLEALLENADKLSPPSVRASVLAARDRLRTNYDLIRLVGAPLPFPLEKLLWGKVPLSTTETLLSLGILP